MKSAAAALTLVLVVSSLIFGGFCIGLVLSSLPATSVAFGGGIGFGVVSTS